MSLAWDGCRFCIKENLTCASVWAQCFVSIFSFTSSRQPSGIMMVVFSSANVETEAPESAGLAQTCRIRRDRWPAVCSGPDSPAGVAEGGKPSDSRSPVIGRMQLDGRTIPASRKKLNCMRLPQNPPICGGVAFPCQRMSYRDVIAEDGRRWRGV